MNWFISSQTQKRKRGSKTLMSLSNVSKNVVTDSERPSPAIIYLFKMNNRNSTEWCEICLKLTITTPDWCHWLFSSVFIVNIKQISHTFLVVLLSTLSMYLFAKFYNLHYSHPCVLICMHGVFSVCSHLAKQAKLKVTVIITDWTGSKMNMVF